MSSALQHHHNNFLYKITIVLQAYGGYCKDSNSTILRSAHESFSGLFLSKCYLKSTISEAYIANLILSSERVFPWKFVSS